METIKEILQEPKDNLKIHLHKRALILQALIQTNFNIDKALKLNYQEEEKSFNSYYKEILALFPGGIIALKQKYKKEYGKP